MKKVNGVLIGKELNLDLKTKRIIKGLGAGIYHKAFYNETIPHLNGQFFFWMKVKEFKRLNEQEI